MFNVSSVNSSSSSEASSTPLLRLNENFVINNDNIHSDHRQNSDLSLKCLYTNAQSIVNKHFELQALVDMYDPDFIGITETWLNSNISDKEYCIDGYHKPIRQDRMDTKDGRGGGVLLLVKSYKTLFKLFLTIV